MFGLSHRWWLAVAAGCLPDPAGRITLSAVVRFCTLGVILLALTFGSALAGQTVADLKAEHDPARRSELALTYADSAFDSARSFYTHGEIEKGDAQLENMTNALNMCVASLEQAHKAKFYKKAELKVAYLQRRMSGLLDDVDVEHRGWAEYTDRKLEEIHDKLLSGVMRK